MQFSPLIIAAAVAATGADALAPQALVTAVEHNLPRRAMVTGYSYGYSNGTYSNATATETVKQTVTAYVTYCPTPTEFVEGSKTYTATAETWVTVQCPGFCTIGNQVGAEPTVVPVGVYPVYNNNTTPACPTGQQCADVAAGVGAGAGSDAGAGAGSSAGAGAGAGAETPGAAAAPGSPASPGADNGVSGNPATTGGVGAGNVPATFEGTAAKVAVSSAAFALIGAFAFFL